MPKFYTRYPGVQVGTKIDDTVYSPSMKTCIICECPTSWMNLEYLYHVCSTECNEKLNQEFGGG